MIDMLQSSLFIVGSRQHEKDKVCNKTLCETPGARIEWDSSNCPHSRVSACCLVYIATKSRYFEERRRCELSERKISVPGKVEPTIWH